MPVYRVKAKTVEGGAYTSFKVEAPDLTELRKQLAEDHNLGKILRVKRVS